MLTSERIQVCNQKQNNKCTHKGIGLISAARKTETCNSWKTIHLSNTFVSCSNDSPQVNTQISSVLRLQLVGLIIVGQNVLAFVENSTRVLQKGTNLCSATLTMKYYVIVDDL